VKIEAPSLDKKFKAPPVSREPVSSQPPAREATDPSQPSARPPRRDMPPVVPLPTEVERVDLIPPRASVMPPIDRTQRSKFLCILQTIFRPGSPTDAGLILTGIMATLTTLFVYLVFIPLFRQTYLGGLLAERGCVLCTMLWFTFWAYAILIVKLWKLAGQRATPAFDLFPKDNSVVITHANVDLFQQNLAPLHLKPRRHFLDHRLMLALDHFRAGKSTEEVATVLNTQAKIDGAAVASSYTMLRVIIWAIPMLGFVGMILGFSDAVQGFAGLVPEAQDIEAIKQALGQVTNGLTLAFDNILVALVLSIVIKFPAHLLQKAEEDLLAAVDQCCNSGLLRCLKDG